MFLVRVSRIFKNAMRASFGEATSKIACEISAFYNFVENSINLYVLKSSISRDSKKFPFSGVTSLKHTRTLLKTIS